MEANSTISQLKTLEGHSDRVWSLAWSPSGMLPPLGGVERGLTAAQRVACAA